MARIFFMWVINAVITFTFPSAVASLESQVGSHHSVNLVILMILAKILPETK